LKLLPGKGKYWHTLAEVEWYGFKNREKALAALYKAKEVQQHYKGGDQLIGNWKRLSNLISGQEVQQHYKGGDQLIRELEAPF
jgi:hypothetical protein